jgi:hypothetical protein
MAISDCLVKALEQKKMLIRTALLPLSLLLGMMILTEVTAQANDYSLPVNMEEVVVPQTMDNMGPIAYPTEVSRPTEVPRAKRPREPFHHPLPGPSRM